MLDNEEDFKSKLDYRYQKRRIYYGSNPSQSIEDDNPNISTSKNYIMPREGNVYH